MLTLKDYVNWGITHSDKTGSAEGVPLVMEKCVKNKKMKQLEVYGNSIQNGTPSPEAPVEVESVGELVTDTTDTNYGKYKIPVTVRGKNLFKPSVVSTNTIRIDRGPSSNSAYGTVIDSTDLSDNRVTVTQTPNSDYATGSYNNGFIYFEIPKLVVGGKYVLSFDLNITDNPLNATSLVMYALNTSIGAVSVTSTRCKKTFVYKEPISERKPDVELRCGGMSFELSNVMITEEGHDDTFEPYIEPITTNVYLNEPLRKIGDYADYIDFKGKKVVRNTKEKIFDGSKSWVHELTSGGNNFYTFMADAKGDSTLKVLCNMGTHNGTSLRDNYSCRISGSKNFNFRYQDYDNVADFKAKLTEMYNNNNPMTLVYVIETPYEESIQCDLLILTAKTSIVDIDTSLLPSNIKGKYIKR